MSYPDDDLPGMTTRTVGENRVVITGVQIPFGDLVVLIIKFVLASIPAYIIIFIFAMILAGVFGGLMGGLVGGLR